MIWEAAETVGVCVVVVGMLATCIAHWVRLLDRRSVRLVVAVASETAPFVIPAMALVFVADAMATGKIHDIGWRTFGVVAWILLGGDDGRWNRRRRRLRNKIRRLVSGRLVAESVP